MTYSDNTIKLSKFIYGAFRKLKAAEEAGQDTAKIRANLKALARELIESTSKDRKPITLQRSEFEAMFDKPYLEAYMFWRGVAAVFKADYDEIDKNASNVIKQQYRDYNEARTMYVNERTDEACKNLLLACENLIANPRFNSKCKLYKEVYEVVNEPTKALEYAQPKPQRSEPHQLANDEFWAAWKAAKVVDNSSPNIMEVQRELVLCANHLLKFEPDHAFAKKCAKATIDINAFEGRGGIKLGE